MAIWVAMAAMVVVVTYGVLRKTLRPVLLCWRERAEVHKLDDQLKRAEREHRALLERRRYLRSPEGAEIEARKLGYVRPGEISIMIGDEDGRQKDEPPLKGREEPASGTNKDGL